MTKPYLISIFILTAFVFVQCNKDEEEVSLSAAIENYADIVHANYEDSYKTAIELQLAIEAFSENPSQSQFDICKTAWKNARIPYGQTEAFRFYGGPIDDENGPEGLINSWPLDESYIDYVVGCESCGIINNSDDYPMISTDLIESLNQTGGDTEEQSEVNVASGYHAIEFLLWGQDLNTEGPGQRSLADFTENSNAQRRLEYLKASATLLVSHLKLLVDEWENGGDYRNAFLEMNESDAVTKIFTGIGELSKGELAGERMIVAIESQDQENEHSCFSDNTHVDIKMNFLGIDNVIKGSYTKVDGTVVSGISFLSAISDETVKSQLSDQLSEITKQMETLPYPIDQAIINDAETLENIAISLSDLSDIIVEAGVKLGAKF